MTVRKLPEKQKFYNWYTANREDLDQRLGSSHRIASLYKKQNQTQLTPHGLTRWVQEIRRGEWDEWINDPQDIGESIAANARTAAVAFGRQEEEELDRLDNDPLGLNEVQDIKAQFVEIPETYADYMAPLKLDGYGKKLGIVSDHHFPIHDRPAVMAAHSHLKSEKIDCLLLLGDILDCSNITRHPLRKKLRYTWREELEVGRAYIRSLRVLFPDIPIVYAQGNHESWFQQYIIRQAAQIEGDYVLQERLKLDEYKVEWVDETRLMTYGDLFLHHGHRLGVGSGSNAAKRLLDRHGVNLLIGHFHKEMRDEKRNLDEKTHAVWVNSCLADLHPDYNPHNSSTHGCSIVNLMKDGMFHVQQYKIIGGRVVGY